MTRRDDHTYDHDIYGEDDLTGITGMGWVRLTPEQRALYRAPVRKQTPEERAKYRTYEQWLKDRGHA